MKTLDFNKIYIADPDSVSSKMMDMLVMCGSNNWDFYFEETDGNYMEVLENVRLLEFENKKEMQEYMKFNNIIDFSMEHIKPYVLIYN